jgi:hypothetical protein
MQIQILILTCKANLVNNNIMYNSIKKRVNVYPAIKNLVLIAAIFSFPFLCNSSSASGIATDAIYNPSFINTVHSSFSIGIASWLGIAVAFSFVLFSFIIKTEQKPVNQTVTESANLFNIRRPLAHTEKKTSLKIVQPAYRKKALHRSQSIRKPWLMSLNAIHFIKAAQVKQTSAAS